MVGFEKALRAVEMVKDEIQYRSQSLLNLARGYFSTSGTIISRALNFTIFHKNISVCHIN